MVLRSSLSAYGISFAYVQKNQKADSVAASGSSSKVGLFMKSFPSDVPQRR